MGTKQKIPCGMWSIIASTVIVQRPNDKQRERHSKFRMTFVITIRAGARAKVGAPSRVSIASLSKYMRP